MEKVVKRYEMALQTLVTLKNVLDKLQGDVPEEYRLELRDSAIQRFEYSIDTFWKFLKIYLQDHLKMTGESSSPRAIIKDALGANLLSIEEFELLMHGITNRNETSHAYNESIAQEVMNELPQLYELMHRIIMRIKVG
jgi:nucleotidyltransferase substrate binding protein (TIGR01987 family)